MTTKILLSRGVGTTEIIYLPHPRTRKPVQFLLRDDAVEELLDVSAPIEQSYMLDHRVISSAPLLLATPYDIRFTLIGHLGGTESAAQNYVDIDDLLDGLPRRIQTLVEPHLADVCEALDGAYWRFSLEKCLVLLQSKVRRLENSLPAAVVVKLPDEPRLEALARTQAAVELVSSYLPPRVAAALYGKYDFAELDAHEKAVSQSAYVNPMDFVKGKDTDPDDVQIKPVLKKARSSGVDKLAKANTKGMKQLTSFFKPKASK